MGQGIKYGIAAVGTLLLLTILSWKAEEPKKAQAETLSTGMVMEGGTLNAAPKKEVEVTPLTNTGAAPAATPVKPNLLSQGKATTVQDFSANKTIKTGAVQPNLAPAKNPGSVAGPLLAGTGTFKPKPISTGPQSATATTPNIVPAAKQTATPAVSQSNASMSKAIPDRALWKKYSVKPGDSLYAIARKTLGNGSRWKAIIKANPRLKSPGHLRTGMTLLIPTSEFVAANTTKSRPKTTTTAVREDAGAGDCEAPSSDHYVVKSGDTLSKIAAAKLGSRKYWKKLYNANRHVLKSPNHLRAGQKLTIPAR